MSGPFVQNMVFVLNLFCEERFTFNADMNYQAWSTKAEALH